jgi:hypothetical protein
MHLLSIHRQKLQTWLNTASYICLLKLTLPFVNVVHKNSSSPSSRKKIVEFTPHLYEIRLKQKFANSVWPVRQIQLLSVSIKFYWDSAIH